jgi:uncharacterized Zn-binding protein involved in type VI secretion
MRPVVLVGHRHLCPIHGMGTVVSGTSGMSVSDRAVARIGDLTSCGAVIVSGSASEFCGAGVARVGDTTSHGGALIEGESGWLIE